MEARLILFNVSSVTGGSDALGDVVVQLDVDGRRVTGRGVSVGGCGRDGGCTAGLGHKDFSAVETEQQPEWVT